MFDRINKKVLTLYVAASGFLCGATQSAVSCTAPLDHERQKFEQDWLGCHGGQVRFLCTRRAYMLTGPEENYSATYNLDAHNFAVTYNKKQYDLPLVEGLTNELLKGFVLKPGHKHPRTSRGGFSLQSVAWENYNSVEFFSEHLDSIFLKNISCLGSQNSKSDSTHDWDHTICQKWPEPPEDVLRSFVTRDQKVFWSFQTVRDFYQRIMTPKNAKEGETDFFIIFKGVGIFMGTIKSKSHKIKKARPSRSLFHYRVQHYEYG